MTSAPPDPNAMLMGGGDAERIDVGRTVVGKSDVELMKIMWQRAGWDLPNTEIVDIQRNPNGRSETARRRPRIVPPGRDIALLYYSPSSTANLPDGDRYSLNLWKQRQTALGVAMDPGLQDLIISHQDDKDELDRLVNRAMRVARADTGADKGTARHKLAEKIDFGIDPGPLSPRMRADIDAYRHATRGLEMVLGEMFVVDDVHKMGGTFDRVVSYQGRTYIADLKPPSTGFGQGAHAVQFAIYSRSELYNWNLAQTMIAAGRAKELPTTNLRSALPGPVDQERAIVIHVPRDGIGRAHIAWINIADGWDGFEHAQWMRRWQNRDYQESLETPFEPKVPATVIDLGKRRAPGTPPTLVRRVELPSPPDDTPLAPLPAPAADATPPADDATPPEEATRGELWAAITSAPDTVVLTALWRANQHRWTDAYTALAKRRKGELASGTPAPSAAAR